MNRQRKTKWYRFLSFSIIFTGVILVFSLKTLQAKGVEFWSVELARTIMERYPDPWDYPYRVWCYPQGHMLEGFDKLRKYTGDEDKKYYNYILKYAEHFVDDNGNLSSYRGSSMDDMMAGAIICWVYNETKEERFKRAADKIRDDFNDYPRTSDDAFWHSRGSTGQFWIDGVFMGEMFLTRYGKYVGDSEYCFNEAARQLKLAFKHFPKGNTNLLYHAWDETKNASWADDNTGLSPEIWAEGMGWYANMLVEALDFMPADHADRATLEMQLDSLAVGLKNYQDTSGCWWNIVDKPHVGKNWTDVSGTSYFVYTLQKGIELGLLDADVYGPVVEEGYACLQTKAEINNDGLVDIARTCDGLSVQSSFDRYMNCSRYQLNAKEAVAAFLWATGIVEKPGQTKIAGKPQYSRKNTVAFNIKRVGNLPALTLSVDQSHALKIDVVSANGRKVFSHTESVKTPGKQIITIKTHSDFLPDGVYFVTVNTGTKSITTPFARVK